MMGTGVLTQTLRETTHDESESFGHHRKHHTLIAST
jgi:hypothetical protein